MPAGVKVIETETTPLPPPLQNALTDADAAVALRPDWAKAYGRRGTAYLGLGQVGGASFGGLIMKDWKEAIGVSQKGGLWGARLGQGVLEARSGGGLHAGLRCPLGGE